MTVRVRGIREAQAALDGAIKDVNIQSELLVTVILQGISQHTLPYVPVDTSDLIGSELRTTEMTANGPHGSISFRATTKGGEDYAVFVHEGPQKRWQKPGASNRYLQRGVEDFIAEDLQGVLKIFEGR